MLYRRIRFLVLLFVIMLTANLQAQQSRNEELTLKQQEKAKLLHKYVPNRAEGLVIKIQKWGLLGLASGVYPYFGSAFPGGGFALGAGYRHGVADNGAFDVHGAYSIAGYKLFESSLRLPEPGAGRVKSSVLARYQNADEVAFYGIGNDTSKSDKTAFTFIPKQVGLTESLWLTHQFHVGGAIAYLDIDTKPGNSPTFPSIEQDFTPAEVPGLGADPQYVTGNLFAEFDWRQSPGWTSRGGFYRVDWYDYNQRNEDAFSFHRWDVELVQHFPILRGNQVLAFRGLASFTDISDAQQVPHFLLPKLGGGSELRGFGDFRFQDRNRLLLTAEYRWASSKFLDMVVFYEAGKVAAKSSDLDTKDLHRCYGIGARFHSPGFTAFRVELAHSVEGTRIILSGGAAF
jgi:Omp85 superfamily domain